MKWSLLYKCWIRHVAGGVQISPLKVTTTRHPIYSSFTFYTFFDIYSIIFFRFDPLLYSLLLISLSLSFSLFLSLSLFLFFSLSFCSFRSTIHLSHFLYIILFAICITFILVYTLSHTSFCHFYSCFIILSYSFQSISFILYPFFNQCLILSISLSFSSHIFMTHFILRSFWLNQKAKEKESKREDKGVEQRKREKKRMSRLVVEVVVVVVAGQ